MGDSRLRLSRTGSSIFRSVLSLVLLSVIVFPLFWLFVAAFKSQADIQLIPVRWLPEQPTLEAFGAVWLDRTGTGAMWTRYFLNTILVSIVTTTIVVAFGTMIGYGLARYRLPGSSFVLTVLLLAQLFTGPALMIPVYVVMARIGLHNTLTGLMLVYVVFQTPFAAWLSYSNFQNLPRELEQAAAIDGCSPIQAFLMVTLPLSRIGVTTVGLMSLLLTWSEYPFAVALLETTEKLTVSIGLARFITAFNVYWNQMAAASIIIAVPVLAILIFTQRYFIQGLMAGSEK